MDMQMIWPRVRRLEDAQAAGGSGYVKPGKVYTYDGKAEDLVELTAGNMMATYACIATNAPHLTTMVRAVATDINGRTEEANAEDCSLEILDDGREVASYKLGGYYEIPFAVWDEGRLYLYSVDTFGYTSRIEFAETIHPIDPKFIPGAVLPVVELTTEPTTDGAALTEAESAMMDELVANRMPFVGHIGGDMLFSGVFSGVVAGDTASYSCRQYVGESAALHYQISKEDGKWLAFVLEVGNG